MVEQTPRKMDAKTRTLLKIGSITLLVHGSAAIAGPASTHLELGNPEDAKRYIAQGVSEIAVGLAGTTYLITSREQGNQPTRSTRPRWRR